MNLPGNERFIYTTNHSVDEATAKKIRAKAHPAGTVVFPKIGGAISTNKRRILVKPTAIDNNCLGIIPNNRCTTEWLHLVLSSIDLAKHQSGTSVPALSQAVIGAIPVAIPPLQEQKRIVAKVDELMRLCDELEVRQQAMRESRARLNGVTLAPLNNAASLMPEEFERASVHIADNFATLYDSAETVGKLRSTILQLAVQGKLVLQDLKDVPATELLRDINSVKGRLSEQKLIKKPQACPPIDDDEIPFTAPSTWRWVRLNDVFDVRDGTHDTPKYVADGFPLVTSKNLYTGELDFSNVKYISETDHLQISERSRVERDDILFAMIGSIGNPVIVRTNSEFSIKNVALFKYYSRDLSEPNFLHLFLRNIEDKMREESAGGVQSFVSLGFLRRYPFPLPPLAEQKRIVVKVKQLTSLCDELETKLRKAEAYSEKLMNAAVHHVLKTISEATKSIEQLSSISA